MFKQRENKSSPLMSLDQLAEHFDWWMHFTIGHNSSDVEELLSWLHLHYEMESISTSIEDYSHFCKLAKLIAKQGYRTDMVIPEENFNKAISTAIQRIQRVKAPIDNDFFHLGISSEPNKSELLIQKYKNGTITLRALFREVGTDDSVRSMLIELIHANSVSSEASNKHEHKGVDARLFVNATDQMKDRVTKENNIFKKISEGVKRKIDLYKSLDVAKDCARAIVLKKCQTTILILGPDAQVDAKNQKGEVKENIKVKVQDIRDIFSDEAYRRIYDKFLDNPETPSIDEIRKAYDEFKFNTEIQSLITREIEAEINKLFEKNINLYQVIGISDITTSSDEVLSHCKKLLLNSNIAPNTKELIREVAVYIFEDEQLRASHDKRWRTQYKFTSPSPC